MAESLLNYKGPFNFSTIDVLLTRFKVGSQEYEIRFAVYKRIVSVMIEALENVYKYSDQFQDFIANNEQYQPTFKITIADGNLTMKTGNPVRNEDVEILRMKIERVNNKSREDLKKLYVDTITNGEFSAKGGAGLGLIEMAKTSGQNLAYSFESISENYSWYSFGVSFKL